MKTLNGGGDKPKSKSKPASKKAESAKPASKKAETTKPASKKAETTKPASKKETTKPASKKEKEAPIKEDKAEAETEETTGEKRGAGEAEKKEKPVSKKAKYVSLSTFELGDANEIGLPKNRLRVLGNLLVVVLRSRWYQVGRPGGIVKGKESKNGCMLHAPPDAKCK